MRGGLGVSPRISFLKGAEQRDSDAQRLRAPNIL